MVNESVVLVASNVSTVTMPFWGTILTAIIILLLGFVLSRIIVRLFDKLFELSELNKLFASLFDLRYNVSALLSKIITYICYLTVITLALKELGIASTVITGIILLITIVVVLFVLFGLGDVFANMFAGIVIVFKHEICEGDIIKVLDPRIHTKTLTGKIHKLSLLYIQIIDSKGQLIFIPNMAAFKNTLKKINP